VISPEAVDEFKMLYFKEYGIKLSNEQAYDYGTKLIGLIKIVYGSNLPKNGSLLLTRVRKTK